MGPRSAWKVWPRAPEGEDFYYYFFYFFSFIYFHFLSLLMSGTLKSRANLPVRESGPDFELFSSIIIDLSVLCFLRGIGLYSFFSWKRASMCIYNYVITLGDHCPQRHLVAVQESNLVSNHRGIVHTSQVQPHLVTA